MVLAVAPAMPPTKTRVTTSSAFPNAEKIFFLLLSISFPVLLETEDSTVLIEFSLFEPAITLFEEFSAYRCVVLRNKVV